MSLLGSHYRPPSLPVTSRNAFSWASMIFDFPELHRTQQNRDPSRRRFHTQQKERLRRQQARESNTSLEDIFVRSLVIASSCPRHSIQHHTRPASHNARSTFSKHGRSHAGPHTQRRFESSVARRPTEEEPEQEEITKEEYKELVNTYELASDLWEPPRPKTNYLPLAPRMFMSAEEEDRLDGRRTLAIPEDRDHGQQLADLFYTLDRDVGTISLDSLWKSYLKLRSPRLRYIPDKYVGLLFKHLTWVEFKHTEGAMERFFAFTNECLQEDVHIRVNEWNSAISFAGRSVRGVTDQEVKSAVETWMRMERSGIQADHVTFNILFDIAVRASRYGLADTICNELQQRELPLNRYFRTSMIYYAGIRSDGDAVRQAFRDFVDADEIVDTSVMNCVILSLIRAGEGPAAENTFAKMKRLCDEKLGTIGPERWHEQSKIGRRLSRAAFDLREQRKTHTDSFFGTRFSSDDQKEEMQRTSPIAPNSRTYRILIHHHASTTGEFESIEQLLREMDDRDLPIHGSIYAHIFRGFWNHGGYAGSAWTRDNLQALWEAFFEVATQGGPAEPDVDSAEIQENDFDSRGETERAAYFTRSICMAAVDAFHKCAGPTKMKEVWEEIKKADTDMSDEDLMRVARLVDRHKQEDNMYNVE